jgi:hypothetical protein
MIGSGPFTKQNWLTLFRVVVSTQIKGESEGFRLFSGIYDFVRPLIVG